MRNKKDCSDVSARQAMELGALFRRKSDNMEKKKKLRVFEAFAGIGAQASALAEFTHFSQTVVLKGEHHASNCFRKTSFCQPPVGACWIPMIGG